MIPGWVGTLKDDLLSDTGYLLAWYPSCQPASGVKASKETQITDK